VKESSWFFYQRIKSSFKSTDKIYETNESRFYGFSPTWFFPYVIFLDRPSGKLADPTPLSRGLESKEADLMFLSEN